MHARLLRAVRAYHRLSHSRPSATRESLRGIGKYESSKRTF